MKTTIFIFTTLLLFLNACGVDSSGSISQTTVAQLPTDITNRSITMTNRSGNAAPAGSQTTYFFNATSITGIGPGGTFTATNWKYTGTTAQADVVITFPSGTETYTLTPITNTTGTYAYVGVLAGATYTATGDYVIN